MKPRKIITLQNHKITKIQEKFKNSKNQKMKKSKIQKKIQNFKNQRQN